MKIGALKCEIVDIRREFIEELCFPAIACNAVYENVYLLGTSLARPVIARAQIDVAQVRFTSPPPERCHTDPNLARGLLRCLPRLHR